jgi:hypothetical protein
MKKKGILFVGILFLLAIVGGVDALTMGLVGYWQFDEGSGTVVYDSSQNYNDGIIYGAKWTKGVSDSALDFDGVNDYVEIPTTTSLDSTRNSITIEGWICPRKTSGVVIWSRSAGYMQTNWLAISNGLLYWRLYRDPYQYTPHDIASVSNITPNRWHHIAATYDGREMRLYIDGVLDNQRYDPFGRIRYNPGYSMHIGVWSDYRASKDNYFDGKIDEFSLYNRALNAGEIRANYEKYSPAPFCIGPIPANINIDPDTLNLKARGVFTAYITLPEGYSVEDIDVVSLECEGAHAIKTSIEDDTLVAKFDRKDLVGIETGDKVALTVTGSLNDGTPFEGSDTIRVISKGK